MVKHIIQGQKGWSLPRFLELFGTEENCKENRKSLGFRCQSYREDSIKGRKMDALTPVGVERILGAMAHVENPKSATGKGCNPATVKNVFGLIRGFYNWAIKRKIFTGENPCAGIELPKFDNRQTNFLSRK